MNHEISDGRLVVSLAGRIDSNSAPGVEAELLPLAEANAQLPVELDASGLEYISSAGLRVVMRLLKAHGAGVGVTNAAPEVYEVFDMTGISQMMAVERALREVSVKGCEVVGQGGNGTVYRLDEDTIVKVYRPWIGIDAVRRERDFARNAFVRGVPSVIAYDVVRVGECLGVVFEMIRSDTLGHLMRDDPDRLDEYVVKYVDLARALHATHVEPGTFTDIHDIMHERADRLGEWCSADEITLLHDITDAVPHADTLTHNDLHPGNIMVQDGELLLIDMPEVTVAPPVCDLVSIYRDMISAPQTQASVIERSVGMPAEQILKVGNLFFSGYTGITDASELEAYYKRLGLLYAFNVTFMPATGSENSRRFAGAIMDNLLRKVVVPNAEAIKGLFQVM